MGGASVGCSVGGASGASGAALAGGSVCSDVGEVVKTGWASHARFMQPPPRGHGSLRIIPRMRGRSCEWRTGRDAGPLWWLEGARDHADPPHERRALCSPGGGLFSAPGCPGSIVGATAFHFRVRDGNGWCHRALTTRTTYYRTSAREPQAPQPLVNTSLERLDGSTAGGEGRSGRAAVGGPQCHHAAGPPCRWRGAWGPGHENGRSRCSARSLFGSGRGIRTPDLRVMSPMSYRCSIPRRCAASIARPSGVTRVGGVPAPAHGRAHERMSYNVGVYGGRGSRMCLMKGQALDH